jgi:glycyl-tRNA synthetase
VYKRAKGQLSKPAATVFQPILAQEPAEKQLNQALDKLHQQWKQTLHERNYMHAFKLMATLQQPLAKLFDTVKILADDPNLRENRIALLQKVFAYFEQLIDFHKIQE